MRILIMTASYAPVLGGLQTVTGQLAHGLQALGHEVRVVTNRFPRTLPESETIGGVPVQRKLFVWPRRAQWPRPHLWLESMWLHSGTLQWLCALVDEWQPDVINVHFPDGQIPYLLHLREQYTGRVVVSLHGDEVMRYFDRIPRVKATDLSELLGMADAVTACSRDLLQHAIQLAHTVQDKGSVIYNGVNIMPFAKATPYTHLRPYVFALGRLTRIKGFDLLLEAWAACQTKLGGLDLILAGDGEENESLKQQARELHLGERVHFFGRATPEEVTALMRGSNFVVVPSRDESFGIVAIEALAAQTPLLATDVGGLREIVDMLPGTGGDQYPVKLIPVTREALRGALIDFRHRTKKADQMREYSAFVGAAFSWQQTISKYAQVLQQ